MTTPNSPRPVADAPESLPQGVVEISHWGVLRAEGEDAAKFLHSQLTHDFALLGLSEARLAAFCNAKGRMLASFIGFKHRHGDILLLCPRDVLPAALKRLSMFVLRAKVKLSDASADWRLHGLAGEAVPTGLLPWQQRSEAAAEGEAALAHTLGLYPGAGLARAIRISRPDSAAPTGAPMTRASWDWLEVMSGIAMITPPVAEAFVPQMLNYESVGGVNFKKGCYPGQEVVARSQFRGTLKRRAFIAQVDADATLGQAVFHHSDTEQPCGSVAAAAPTPGRAGSQTLIVSVTLAAAHDGPLRLGAPEGPALTLLPLPYALLADV